MVDLNAEFLFRRADFTLDVNFQSAGPGVLGVYGRGGAGKSTLLHLCAGLLKPERGTLRLGAELLFGPGVNRPSRERRLGYVFQDARVFPHQNVRANVLFGQGRAGHSVLQCFAPERLRELLGLETLWNRPARELSGGEQKRVAIARALATAPQLLLCDEATVALDAAVRDRFLKYLRELPEHTRTVFVSHQLSEIAAVADELLILDAGRVLYCGSLAKMARDQAGVDLFERLAQLPPLVLTATQLRALAEYSNRRLSAAVTSLMQTGAGKVVVRTEQLYLAGPQAGDVNVPDVWPVQLRQWVPVEGTWLARVELMKTGIQLLLPMHGVSPADSGWQIAQDLWCLVPSDAVHLQM